MSDINLDGLAFSLFLILLGPPIFLVLIGGILRYNQRKKAANVFFILAAVYVVVILGIFGSAMV